MSGVVAVDAVSATNAISRSLFGSTNLLISGKPTLKGDHVLTLSSFFSNLLSALLVVEAITVNNRRMSL